MRNKIGIAVWGAGFAGDFHVKGWQNVRLMGYDVEVVAIMNRTKSKAERLMQKYGVQHQFGDLGQLLDSQLAFQIAGDIVKALLSGDGECLHEPGRGVAAVEVLRGRDHFPDGDHPKILVRRGRHEGKRIPDVEIFAIPGCLPSQIERRVGLLHHGG